jgi:hypothetical protein
MYRELVVLDTAPNSGRSFDDFGIVPVAPTRKA